MSAAGADADAHTGGHDTDDAEADVDTKAGAHGIFEAADLHPAHAERGLASSGSAANPTELAPDAAKVLSFLCSPAGRSALTLVEGEAVAATDLFQRVALRSAFTRAVSPVPLPLPPPPLPDAIVALMPRPSLPPLVPAFLAPELRKVVDVAAPRLGLDDGNKGCAAGAEP